MAGTTDATRIFDKYLQLARIRLGSSRIRYLPLAKHLSVSKRVLILKYAPLFKVLIGMDLPLLSLLSEKLSIQDKKLSVFLYLLELANEKQWMDMSTLNELIVIGEDIVASLDADSSHVAGEAERAVIRLLSLLHQVVYHSIHTEEEIDAAICLRQRCLADEGTVDGDQILLDYSVLAIHYAVKFRNSWDLATMNEALKHDRSRYRAVCKKVIGSSRHHGPCSVVHGQSGAGVGEASPPTAFDVLIKYFQVIRQKQLAGTMPKLVKKPICEQLFSLLTYFPLQMWNDKAKRNQQTISEAILIGQLMMRTATHISTFNEQFVKLAMSMTSLQPAEWNINTDECLLDDDSGRKLWTLVGLAILYGFRPHTELDELRQGLQALISIFRRFISLNHDVLHSSIGKFALALLLLCSVGLKLSPDSQDLNECVLLLRSAYRSEGMSFLQPIIKILLVVLRTIRYWTFGAEEANVGLKAIVKTLRSSIPDGFLDFVVKRDKANLHTYEDALQFLLVEEDPSTAKLFDIVIHHGRESLQNSHKGTLQYVSIKVGLAVVLTERCRRVDDDQNAAYLQEAIILLEQLFEQRSKIPDALQNYVNGNLAHCYFLRFHSTGALSDLNRCIRLQESTLKDVSQPAKEWERLSTRNVLVNFTNDAQGELAAAYWERFNLQKKEGDLDACLQLYGDLMNNSAQPVEVRIILALTAAHISQSHGRFEDSVVAYRKVIDLLPHHFMLGRNYRDRGLYITRTAFAIVRPIKEGSWDNLASDAAAACLSCGRTCEALELLEMGRSIGWTRGLQLRIRSARLEQEYPDVARRFNDLCTMLDDAQQQELFDDNFINPGTDEGDGLDEAPWERRFDMSLKWNSLISEIRSLAGYEDFLVGLGYDQLKQASEFGPVVLVNLSRYRSDALILSHACIDRPQIVSLPSDADLLVERWSDELLRSVKKMNAGHMSESDFSRVVLKPLLNGLWTTIVQPIRASLTALTPYARRLWWLPIGRLTFLPLHILTNGLSEDNTYPQLIPSYLISLSSFLQHRASTQLDTIVQRPKLLAVCCDNADGFQKIRKTKKEIQVLRAHFNDDEVTTLEDSKATVEEVSTAMIEHSWLHLACHGIQSPDKPYESFFALHDGPLRMANIVGARLKQPEFAFLSACHTATGIPKLCDEAMHLAAGLHFAGYRGILGTMWSVHDKTAQKLAAAVYRFLFRNVNEPPNVEDTAEALWQAVDSLRKSNTPLSRLVPFIHIGM